MEKRRAIKSYKNLPLELKIAFDKLYEDGYGGKVQRITTPKGESIFVVPFDTDEANYLIKVKLRVTKADDEEDEEDINDDDVQDLPENENDDEEDDE